MDVPLPRGRLRCRRRAHGEYLLGGEEYFVNDKGESRISYADYAIAMIDEVESAAHIRQRFSVIGK